MRPYQPKRLRKGGRPGKELVAHWQNKLAVPVNFTQEEKGRLRLLAEAHGQHDWVEIAKELGRWVGGWVGW